MQSRSGALLAAARSSRGQTSVDHVHWLTFFWDTSDGDAKHGLAYHSPRLPNQLHISLADPNGDDEVKLFSHFLWNSSLLLAEFLEAGTLMPPNDRPALSSPLGPPLGHFDITDLTLIELGAGTALPSQLAALMGARRVVMTDYPAPAVLSNLCQNVERNIKPEFSPLSIAARVEVDGHAWGDLHTPFAKKNHYAFDRVLACDCLWMPWQHDSLLRSIEWFLKDDQHARCWVVGGFHTGRASLSEFFCEQSLATVGLDIERIWERDCDGAERGWSWDRGLEDVGERKRWLVCAVLKRRARG